MGRELGEGADSGPTWVSSWAGAHAGYRSAAEHRQVLRYTPFDLRIEQVPITGHPSCRAQSAPLLQVHCHQEEGV